LMRVVLPVARGPKRKKEFIANKGFSSKVLFNSI
jgi:hypothetical protein